MGQTTKYGLPWPALTDKVKDGATAIRLLAESVEAALLPPLLVTDGDGNLTWDNKVAEVPWDVTDSPDRKRGGWSSNGNNERLVMPDLPGWYACTASIRFGGKAEPDVYDVQLRTRVAADGAGAGYVWATQRIELPADSANYSVLNVTSLVRIADTTPTKTGLAVRLSYAGSSSPPAVPLGSNKLRMVRVSAL